MNNKMRLALDFGPLLVFFLAYRFAGLAGRHRPL